MNRAGFFISLLLMVCLGRLQAGSLPFSRPGMVDIPTASILNHTQVTFGTSITAYSYENADSSSESDFALAAHLEVGLFNRGQIGVTWLGEAGLSGNARLLVFRETITTPALAVGCQNITGQEDYEFYKESGDSLYHYDIKQNFSFYAVVTKNLDYFSGMPLCIHVGYGTGRFRQAANSPADGVSNPFRGLFGGFDFHPAENLSIMLEWDGRDASFGAQYQLNSTVRFQGAVTEFEQFFLDDRDASDIMQNAKYSLGVEFTIGPFLNRTTLQPYEQLTEDYNRDLLEKLEAIRENAKQEIQELESDVP